MPTRATMDELKEFANKVREAGGGNPIDALMPSVPADSSQCLIAKNLNFNCYVSGVRSPVLGEVDRRWAMYVLDKATRDKIADALDLPKCFKCESLADNPYREEVRVDQFGVILPDDIGQVASDFDSAGDVLGNFKCSIEDIVVDSNINDSDRVTTSEAIRLAWEHIDNGNRQLLAAFLPYIEESEREAYNIASYINPDGTIVI